MNPSIAPRARLSAKLLRAGAVLAVVSSVLACSTPRSQEAASESEIAGPPPARTFGPELPSHRGVILVMGPGMARSFYYAGFLRALRDAKIPISGLVGVEAGALMAGVFATSQTQSEFEWKMMKIKDASFPKPAAGVGKWLGSATSYRREIEDLLGSARIEDAHVPVKVGILDAQSGEVRWATSGRFSDAIAASLAVPGLTPSADFEGTPSASPVLQASVPVAAAREFGDGLVVVPVLTGFPMSNSAAEQSYVEQLIAGRRAGDQAVKSADVVWTVDMRGISFFRMDARRKLEGLGREDGRRRAEEIRRRLQDQASPSG